MFVFLAFCVRLLFSHDQTDMRVVLIFSWGKGANKYILWKNEHHCPRAQQSKGPSLWQRKHWLTFNSHNLNNHHLLLSLWPYEQVVFAVVWWWNTGNQRSCHYNITVNILVPSLPIRNKSMLIGFQEWWQPRCHWIQSMPDPTWFMFRPLWVMATPHPITIL